MKFSIVDRDLRYFQVKTGVTWTYYDNNHPGQVVDNLKAFIRARQNIEPDNLEYWYVGKTDDPKLRLAAHQADCAKRKDHPWTQMFVIYGHRDLGFVTDVENKLITFLRGRAQRRGEQARLLNDAGERYGGRQNYFVYVLVDNHPNSSSGAKERNRGLPPDQSLTFVETTKKAPQPTRERTVTRRFEKAILMDQGFGPEPARCFYVGLTNNPERRYAEHQSKMKREYNGKYWEEMRVVYRTPSLNNAYDIETMLIDFAAVKYPARLQNRTRSLFAGPRDFEEMPYFYVYYLEDRR